MKSKEKSETFNVMRSRRLNSGGQPFKLVKFFSFSSLFVITVFTLVLSWFISNHSQKVMLEQSEEYSLLLAENINQQVFLRFVVPTVLRYGKIALREPEQHALIDKIITGLIDGMSIDAVTIYDSSLNVVSYSTVKEIIGRQGLGGKEYKLALGGASNSRLELEGHVFSLLSSDSNINCQLSTYIPFRQVRKNGVTDGVIMGVIQIDRDLDKEYTSILRLQGRLILISSIMMATLFLVLSLIVFRGNRITEKRSAERRRLEDKLNQAERLAQLGTMIATVSHEIKSPLGIVRSTAEILQKRIAKVAPGNESLAKIIIDETSRLNGIVVEFLDFARPQKMKFELATVDESLGKVLDFVSSELKEKNINLITDFAPDLAHSLLDKESFYRALLNIVMNSIQAMSEGENGQLKVTTSREAGGATKISISDTGPGIEREKLKNIFEPFFTDKHKGTGLGLAIAANIIKSHNGSIEVESTVGEGTCFIIRLPQA